MSTSQDQNIHCLHVLIQWCKLHILLIRVRTKQWLFRRKTSKGMAKLKLSPRPLRTKQILIVLTSGLFIFGTIWFGSHPDQHPLIDNHIQSGYHRLQIPIVVIPFQDSSEILRKLELYHDGPKVRLVNPADENLVSVDNIQIQSLADEPWELKLPSYADMTKPAIVTAIFSTRDWFTDTLHLIHSVNEYAKDSHLLIFNMLEPNRHDSSNLLRITVYCNLTQICSLQDMHELHLGNPPYVYRYLYRQEEGGYKPILLQKSLLTFPSVLWLDFQVQLTSSLSPVWQHTQDHDVTVWALENHCTVSSYTFKGMFPYFNRRPSDFWFITMIKAASYSLKRSESTDVLMTRWLNCTLTQKCLSPSGADNNNCGTVCQSYQPRFDYIGCHMYEASALACSLNSLSYATDDYLISRKFHTNEFFPFGDNKANTTSILSRINKEMSKTEAYDSEGRLQM